MKNCENILAAGLGSAMVLAVLGLSFATHYQALLHPSAANQTASQATIAAAANSGGLNIPTIDEMCKAAGATSENMASCQSDEGSAAEFVIAWMGLNGFLVNGAIDMGQIQLAADLGPDATSPLTDPDPSLDETGLDPSAAEQGLELEPNIDPSTGLPVDQSFDSPAQIAMFCMSNSTDWLQMHDCIYRYDPTSRFDGF